MQFPIAAGVWARLRHFIPLKLSLIPNQVTCRLCVEVEAHELQKRISGIGRKSSQFNQVNLSSYSDPILNLAEGSCRHVLVTTYYLRWP